MLLGAAHARTARERHVLDLRSLEARFLLTGQYAARAIPPDAVVLSVQQSGSIRHHGGRVTAMWDQLQSAELDRAIAWLEGHGRPVFIALEDLEEGKFRARFSSQQYGGLDWPPVAEVHAATRVRIYRAADRERFRRGAPVTTEQVRW